MTLTTRLSMFFLALLAAVLVGFSATLYGLAYTYLHRQIDDRLEAALGTLSATAEIHTDGVEWEPTQRPVSLAMPPGEEPVVWLVRDDRGQVVDRPNAGGGEELLDADPAVWRVGSRRVWPGGEGASTEDHPGEKRYPFLELTAGLSLRPAASALRQLLLALCILSAALWLTAALLGRWLSRRALMPLRRMASAAQAMQAADRDQRLPVSATGDELQELGHAFNDLLARLQESFERQARFSGDASHQLRTPLTSMLGQIEIALRRPRGAEEYHQTLTVLHGQALRMRQIVESLLFLARADAQAKAPQLEPLELTEWLNEHVKSWAHHARAADLRTEISVVALWVQAQAPLLGQLLDTLLDNACKYSPPGTPITIGLSVEKEAAHLTVTDAGCGIAAEDLPHLFEPFYRSPHARRQGVAGLGLGLAVAARIAVALGGSLHVCSRLGQGSQFTLCLPSPLAGESFPRDNSSISSPTLSD